MSTFDRFDRPPIPNNEFFDWQNKGVQSARALVLSQHCGPLDPGS